MVINNKITEYIAISSLGYIELPEKCAEISFSDFSIKCCPNHAEPVQIHLPDGSADVEWVYPDKPDPRFPVCDYYLEMHFSTGEGSSWHEAEWLLAWALTRLRLFKKGHLWSSLYRVNNKASPKIIEGLGNNLGYHKRRPKEPPSIDNIYSLRKYSYEILQSEIEAIRKFVEEMGRSPTKIFQVAIRRFHQSFDRDLPEDRAIDLLIAFESLLNEGGEAIGYKIALRASHILGGVPLEKIEKYKFLKDAYNKRSHIVHGDKSEISWLLGEYNDGITNLDELENILRKVLRVLLSKAGQGKILKPKDLDKFLFFN